MKMRVSLFSIERMHRLPLCREECLSSISTGHAPSLWGGECFRSVHRKYIPLWWGECHIECISSIGCILFIYEWRRKYPSYRSRVRNPYPWRGECVYRLHAGIRLHLYVGDILFSCIEQRSLTSKLVVIGDPSCVSHEFVPFHALATPSWIWWLPRRYFIVQLHTFLGCEHRCWHVANSLVSYWARWYPTYQHVCVEYAICLVLVYVSAMQNVSPVRCSPFVNCRHLCENRIRPKSQIFWIIIIIKK